MSFRCVVGLLNLAIAFATMSPARRNLMVLQNPPDAQESCEGDDCGVEFPSANRSSLADRSAECECCWRDCNIDSPHHRPFPALAKTVIGTDEDLADVDAWLVMCHWRQPLEWNMYTPILETVKIGIESSGGTTRTIGLPDIETMLGAVKASVRAGRRPLVFAVAYWHPTDVALLNQQLRQASEMGAYLVLYNTEPEGYKLDGRTGLPIQIVRAMRSVNDTKAHEMWDYSRANLAHYPARDDLIFRYVPPGYVPKLDVGVDMNSPLKQTQFIGYMGGRASKPKYSKYVEVVHGRMNWTNSIWTQDDLRWWLESWPLQLNQHKGQTCCPREEWEAEYQHLESFRMASLLANKACVISAPSADVDMKEWEGLISFVEVEDTWKKAEELWANLDKCRVNTYETFKRNFAPQELLQRSGFFNVWTPSKK